VSGAVTPLASAPSRTVGEAREHVGEIVAAHRLAEDILILLGWSRDEIAKEGVAALDRNRRERGRCHALSLPPDASGLRWFVAAIRVAGAGAAGPGDALHLHAAGAKAPIIACLPPQIVDAATFAGELAVRLGHRLDAAADFLLTAFSNRASRRLRVVSAFLIAVLEAAAEEDGVIEILGAIEGEGVLVQGWRRHAGGAPQRLFFAGDVLEELDAVCASFARQDLEAECAGFLALARGEADPVTPTQIFLRRDNGFRRLAVLPDGMRLHRDSGANHLRDVLPLLRASEAALRALRTAARPRFTGSDTVSTLDRPVRMAVDLAAPVNGAGWYLTGWLLDPLGLVTAVTLRDTTGAVERLDERWTRVPREDVSNGFRDVPLFHGKISHDRHGFTVFAPSPGGRDAWLELTLVGDHIVFMPLQPIDADGEDGKRRLLTSFDLHKASAGEIVERQLGPLFHAAKGGAKRVVGHRVLRPGRVLADGDGLSASLIIPITEPSCHAGITVASLASCDPGSSIAPLFVCSPGAGASLEALLRALAFYDIDAGVIVAEATVDVCTAVEIGARATRTPVFIVQSPSTHATSTGWAETLVEALGPDAAAASPTLLYEDWSIRYAGIERMRFADHFPYAEAETARAGISRDAVALSAPTPTLAAMLECCALRRSAFESLAGFSTGYALPAANGLDLFLRLAATGKLLLWVPDVALYALDDPPGAESYWVRTGERIDSWSLRASWQGEPLAAPIAAPTAAPSARPPALDPAPRRKSASGRGATQLTAACLKRPPADTEIARSL
jgi:hypothetical protein